MNTTMRVLLFALFMNAVAFGAPLMSITGLARNDCIPYALDLALLHKELKNERLCVRIQMTHSAQHIFTQPEKLPPAAINCIKQFASLIRVAARNDCTIAFDIDLAAASQRIVVTPRPETVYAFNVSFIRKVGVAWPNTTRSKFLGKAIISASISADGEVVQADVVEASNPDYAMNALGAMHMSLFSSGKGLRNVRVQFSNRFDDDGNEFVITELIHGVDARGQAE
jgi:hypothetical protein